MKDNKIGKKFLPIGTVVLLKGGTKRVMINGFCTMAEGKKDEVWDYSGCPFPEGMISSKQVLLFDHEQITEVCHMGLVDAEEKEFKKELKEFLETTNNKK